MCKKFAKKMIHAISHFPTLIVANFCKRLVFASLQNTGVPIRKMWTAVAPSDPNDPAPSARSKHSAILIGDHVYLLGGRNGNLPMKDFWKYNLVSGKWQQLKPGGDTLPCLQEHSAVAYKDSIYVFGGEVGFSAGTETPLWQYDIKNNSWRKLRSKKGVVTPNGRRGHSALVYRNSMIIYGGYQDLRGSCNELWAFHFETESWHLMWKVPPKANSDLYPTSRHKHSAIIHADAMWIYGGMSDLQEKGDLWKWDFASRNWYNIKTKINPGPLHSHAACRLPSAMIIFGGEKAGHPTNELWKFSFNVELWERVAIPGIKPQPRAETVAFAVSELLLNDPSVNSLESKAVKIRARTCNSADRGNRHSSYLPNNRVAPSEKTYVFTPSQTNYIDGSDLAQQYSETRASRSFLQEISKLSQITRLNNKCNYSVLSGSNTDSTESLLKQHTSPSGEVELNLETATSTPQKCNLVKSKSAYAIKKTYNSDNSPSSPEETKEATNKKKVELHSNNLRKNKITREPISVPNFSLLNLPTPTLTPVEATKLVYLDTDEENDLTNDIPSTNIKEIKITESEIKTVKRGESYSSHLAYADNPLYQHMVTSHSVKFQETVEPLEENVSSTSDYASIETVNRLSSASNYSVRAQTQEENMKNRQKDKDGPFGFCNPNYLGPDIKVLLKEENEEKKEIAKLINNHNFSRDNTIKISEDEDVVELRNLNGTYDENTKVYFSTHTKVHCSRITHPPKSLPLECSRPKMNNIKFRALSAGRADRCGKVEKKLEYIENFEPFVPLYIYIMGGKEQGQVTVFKRPISIWKLKLF